ncbi:MAG TPA: glycosyltransferase family 1 protein [Candidatus Dormibacteraeota bacterium]
MRGAVLVDARPLQGPSAVRGIGTYVRGLLGGLERSSPRLELTVLLDAGLPAPALGTRFKAHEVRHRYHGRLAGYEDAVVLPADLDRIRPAVFHATSLSLPSRAPCPVVATCHDLIPWTWGSFRMAGERVRYYPGKRLLRRAEAVIAVSEAVASEAVKRARVEQARLRVIAEGVEPAFHAAEGAESRVASRWGLQPGYFLYVGALDRRKDPVGLVRAWRTALRAGAEAELVIAGEPGPQAPGRMGGARLLGRVTDEELADLYRAAACLLYPSRAEGFGLTVLEAMACGCPVVAYDTPAVAELAAGAAALVPVDSSPLLGRQAAALASDPERRSAAVAAGRKRAALFSWEGAAAATARVYKEVAG